LLARAVDERVVLKRLSIAAGIALVLLLGARFTRTEIAARAWVQRRSELERLALAPETLRRPWEVRYAALERAASGSKRLDELRESPHRPQVAWSGGARALDEVEALWVAAAETEHVGLDSILRELRALPVEELAWHGEPVQLLYLREVVDFLCARAWRATSEGDHAAAARGYGDALRLAQATDGGSLIGTMIRYACQGIVLRSMRAALAFGLSPRELRASAAPVLAAWTYDPKRAERGIRGEITAFLAELGPRAPDHPLEALRQFRTIDEALALARMPLANSPWGGEASESPVPDGPIHWHAGVRQLHAFHAAGNVALTALAVAAHREARGAWPATLAELADLSAEDARDPLTGAPLPYARSAEGVRIGPAAWLERLEPSDDPEGSPFLWTLRE
jgi:hypothetical protein